MNSVYSDDSCETGSSAIASIKNRDSPLSHDTHFALALPTRVRPKTFALFPRLMLQIQQLSADSRPNPVLDIYQPSIFMSGAARSFSTRLKLRKRDICIARSEYLEPLKVEQMQTGRSENSQRQYKEVVSVIRSCRKKNEATSKSPVQGEVYFRQGEFWHCTTVSDGHYQFAMKHEDGITKIAHWKRDRNTEVRSLGESWAGTSDILAGEERFLFSIPDPAGNYTSPFAVLTRKSIKVVCQDSSEARSSYTEHLRDFGLKNLNEDYSIILIFGTWVAFQEGWIE